VFLPAKIDAARGAGALFTLLQPVLVDHSPDFLAISSPIYGYDPVINPRNVIAVKRSCYSCEVDL
jgi:hypothetical protein